MKNRPTRFGVLALSLLVTFALGYWVSRARAAGVPQTSPLNYSGVLSDTNGVPLTGSKNILVQLYGSAAGGTALCTSPATTVTLVGGAFQVPLGDSCTPFVHSMPDLWIDVLVDGSPIGLSKLGAVPYALEADHAQTASALATGPISVALTTHVVPGNALAAPCALSGTSGAVVDCTCPTGSYVVSGGGDAGQSTGHFIRENRPISNTTWRVTCVNGTTDTLCSNYGLVCSRLGP